DGDDDAGVRNGLLVPAGVDDRQAGDHVERERDGDASARERHGGERVIVQRNVKVAFYLRWQEIQLGQLAIRERRERGEDEDVDQAAAAVQHDKVDVHAPCVFARHDAQGGEVDR